MSTPGIKEAYVRYRIAGLAIDDFRLGVDTTAAPGACALNITHNWVENGQPRSATRTIPPGTFETKYVVETAPGAMIENESIVFECPAATTASHR